jgi:ParB family chromosome partitioning protein
MSDTTAKPITLQAYDPGDLLMDANARSNAEGTVTKADVALCTTIAGSRPDGCGNNVPITIVRRPDGRLRVRAGHRRNLGCLRAGVPVLGFVAGAEGDERADRRARLIEQWNENHHRVPMTVRDEGAVVLALFDDEEMTEAAIAKATGLARPQVTASLTVARSQVATSAAERWDFLTLDQAATLAEFEDDQEALTALIQAAKGSPSQFDHVAAQLRATRAEREAKAAFTAELEAQGIAIYGDRPYVPWTLALENLRDSDGNRISPQAHATCPGRAVTITYEWDWAPGAEAAYRAAHNLAGDDDLADIEFGTDEQARQAGFAPGWRIGHYLCTDPDQYGHANVHGTPAGAPTREQQAAEDQAAQAARQSEQRRRVRQRNTAWRAATDTRTSHLKAVLGRKAPPAGALKLVVEAMARGETQPLTSSFGHQTACELLGLAGNGAATGHRDLLLAELARASDKRAHVIALAMVLGAAEHGVRDVHVWQAAEDHYRLHYGIPLAARYLAWLAGHTGYSLSDIEAGVAAHATARADDDGAGQTKASTETS